MICTPIGSPPRTVAEALHRHDPNHLYLGSRFAWRTPEAVEACGLWCDVVSFNLYQRALAKGQGEWARFHALGKPALIGEFHFGSTDRGLFWEGLVGAGRESERGPAYARYLRAVADNPDFVGAHWFQYIDEPLTGVPSTARTRMSALSRLPTCLTCALLPRHATPTCRCCASCTASRAAMRVVSGQFALIELVIVAGFGGPSSAPSRQICCA